MSKWTCILIVSSDGEPESINLFMQLCMDNIIITTPHSQCCTSINFPTSSFVSVLSTLKSFSGSRTAALTYRKKGEKSSIYYYSGSYYECCQCFRDSLSFTTAPSTYLLYNVTNNALSLRIAHVFFTLV